MVTLKQSIIENILNAVSEVTGVRVDSEPCSRRTREIVDARSIAAELMRTAGFSPHESASVMGLSAQSVRSLLHGFPDRMAYGGGMFGVLYLASERKLKASPQERGR